MQIKYVSKEELQPAFGKAKDGIAYVREDLPGAVKTFVLTHELYHLRDASVNWIWREVKANAYAGLYHPCGALWTIALSLTPERIKLYIDRFRKGK